MEWVVIIGFGPAALLLVAALAYVHFDTETESITEEVRRTAGGSFVRLPDGMVHYELAGPPEARAVVLVHGFSVPYYIWDPTFAALVHSGFRVLRYDLYGRGYSDRPNVAYDADLYDRQLLGLLSALSIPGPVDLVGLSMGGPIVVTFADRHPERVRALVLLDSSYHEARRPPVWLGAPLFGKYYGEYYMTVLVSPSLAEGQLADFFQPERFPDWPEKYRVQMQYKGFRRALLSTMRDYMGRDVRGEFERVGQSGRPVLLLWGEADQTVPLPVSDEIRRAIPQAEFHLIQEAGHLPHYERPEVVNPILVGFLKKQ
ncbi:MAG: hypothetical protein A3H28_16480 [Acidobacteria bacterium RIFCSPLOWO2_02_FULL_61_28]|nr:MAG: hypothetical protein A3H28_16480 [Acidobacteria bacterium RIFCSPLOWO2_02_FULL_61_28]